MLKHKIVLTLGFILTLVVHGAAQFDMNSWFSSSEYENSLESASSSEEFETSQEVPNRKSRNVKASLTADSQKLSSSSASCNLEQLPHSNYRSLDRIRYETFNCLKCRNVTLLPGQKLEIQGEPNNLKYIMFESSTIPLIPEGVFTAFANFTQLFQLYLNGSSVNIIKPGAFSGLNILEELYLQKNNITRLSKWVFSYLPHLKILNLADNNVELIQANAFSDLLSLQVLYLNNNNIRIILEDTFSDLKHLRYVDLSNNRLLDVSRILFYTLGILNLRYNNLTAVDFSTFPIYLEQLFLDNNQINYIENLKKLENTALLSLSNNNISSIGNLPDDVVRVNFSRNKVRELSNTVFIHAVYLVTLDFSYNLLEKLSYDLFAQIGNLKEIYFQNNQLTAVPVGCFRNLYLLKLLNLSSNHISDFQFGIFVGLINLEYLDISNNKADFVYENSFQALRNLKVLNIAGNNIISLDPYDIINYSKGLKNITLDNNRWLCKYLSNIVIAFEKAHVQVTNGSKVNGDNVKGIACSDHLIKYTTTLAPYFGNVTANAPLSKLQGISEELKAIRNFFDQDFVNSSFHKYFETLNMKPVINYDSKDISNALLNHIDDSFKNTTFYKYFSSSTSLEALSNISTALRSRDINVGYPDSNSTYISAKYANRVGYPINQDILLKISELQNGITTVMIIVVVMLLSIVLLLIIKKISNPLMRLFNKSVFRKVSRKSNSSAEIELI